MGRKWVEGGGGVKGLIIGGRLLVEVYGIYPSW